MKNSKCLKLKIPNEKAMLELGKLLAEACKESCIIYFIGELGAGKTTLIRGFLQSLGFQGVIKSPTYTLVEPYELSQTPIYHFDLYRLQDPEELEYIGVTDYFTNEAICLIEWPERGQPMLPKADLNCEIKVVDTGRDVTLTATSEVGKKIVGWIKERSDGSTKYKL
jgi:tRNA threonylcarbamoyladenosine biosynthesis protein TsaE